MHEERSTVEGLKVRNMFERSRSADWRNVRRRAESFVLDLKRCQRYKEDVCRARGAFAVDGRELGATLEAGAQDKLASISFISFKPFLADV